MNEELSQAVGDLLAKVKAGQDSSTDITRVCDELRSVIARQDTIFGTFLSLVQSFHEVIPEEKQRYQAALKALSATARLGRQEIIAAVDRQLEELKILEKALVPALPAWHAEQKGMDVRLQQIRNEISKLHEKIELLEREEHQIRGRMTGRQTEMAATENAMQTVFRAIADELTAVKKGIAESALSTAVHSSPPAVEKNAVPAQTAQTPAPAVSLDQASLSPDAESQKQCPMCGGRLDFYFAEKKLQCYACGYEEFGKEEVLVANPIRNEQPAAVPGSAAETVIENKCPMCGGRMDFYFAEKKWQCYSCGFEPEKEPLPSKSEENIDRSASVPVVPVTEPLHDIASKLATSNRYRGTKLSTHHPVVKKKTCPSCSKKMLWHEKDRAWQCGNCGYERRI